MKPIVPTSDDIPELRAALLAHYDREARDLPWRRDRDPYRVLVSEFMLQQTRVETVLGYYEDWLARFPTPEALARADEDEVLKAWEGLGYYRRARNLHRAARVVRESPTGFPETADELRALPGVGEYTAGAVASIAFQEVTPAVDGNVRRVLARLYDEPHPKPAWLRERAAALVDPQRPGDWNQALMELGATVCTPRSPSCDDCPVEAWCAAAAAGTVSHRPAPKARKDIPRASMVLAVLESSGRTLVERRPPGGLLGGMWAFPEAPLDDDAEAVAAEAVAAEAVAATIARRLGFLPSGPPASLESVRHRFSHLDVTYLPVVLQVEEHDGASSSEHRWIDGSDDEVALPVAQRKVLEQWAQARNTEVS